MNRILAVFMACDPAGSKVQFPFPKNHWFKTGSRNCQSAIAHWQLSTGDGKAGLKAPTHEVWVLHILTPTSALGET